MGALVGGVGSGFAGLVGVFAGGGGVCFVGEVMFIIAGGGGIGGGILSTGLISDETPVMSNDRVDRCTALLDDALQPPSLLCAPPLFEADFTGVVSGVL